MRWQDDNKCGTAMTAIMHGRAESSTGAGRRDMHSTSLGLGLHHEYLPAPGFNNFWNAQ
eukprot:SAG31_NODE_38674_length_294_cov_1.035897_1_plen_58_part_10